MSKRLFDSVVMAFCLLLLVYFGWHYYRGPRSLVFHETISAKKLELSAQLEKEVGKRQRLEGKVRLLRPEHIDQDFLDELARRVLNYTSAGELILPR